MSKSRLKAISLRQYPEETDINDWIKNQKNLAESTRLAFRVIAQRYGTGDLRNALIEDALQSPTNISNVAKSNNPAPESNTQQADATSPSSEVTHDDSATVRPKNQPFAKKHNSQLTKDEFNNIDL